MKKKRQPDADVDNESTESCDENQTKSSCSHIIKAVDLTRIKKIMKAGLDKECSECAKKLVNIDDENDFVYDLSLWLCLKCGNQGCGRATNKHALKHFETPHSDSHALCINTSTWKVWCYECSDDVNVDSRKKLLEAAEYIKKQCMQQPKRNVLESFPQETVEMKITNGEQKNKKNVTNLPKVRGLSNLGNTCFFNAVLQCLTQTPFLLSVLKEMSEPGEKFRLPGGTLKLSNGKTEELPSIEGELSHWGPLSETLAKTLDELQNSGRSEVFVPRPLLQQLSHKMPQFGCGDQEDSHELLRHLLEAVRTEDLKRYQSIILTKLGYSIKTNPADVNEEDKQKIKFYGQQASDMILRPEQVFRGILVSTLQCQVCQHSSNRDENFLDLSLPVMADKPQPPIIRRIKTEIEDENKPSKHQMKKEKKMQRKGRKMKPKANNEGESITEENTQVGTESEQSDADVEDNVEEGVKERPTEDKNVIESGYNSDEKKDLPEFEKNEDIVTQNNTKNLSESQSDVNLILSNIKSEKNSNRTEEFDSAHGVDENPNTETTDKSKSNQCLLSINVTSVDSQEHTSSVSPNISASPLSSEAIDLSSPQQNENKSLSEYERSSCLPHNRNSPSEEVASKKSVLDINELSRITIEKKLGGGSPDGENTENNSVIALGWKMDNDDSMPELIEPSLGYFNKFVPPAPKLPEYPISSNPVTNYSWSSSTVGSRYQADEGECSIQSCLNQFTALELMTGNNKVCCESCTERSNGKNGKSVYTDSSKQLLISSPPAILILHLKRFQVSRSFYRKMSKHVNFPLVLDIAPFCSNKCKDLPSINNRQNKLLYSLYGVVEHTGTLHGGHYVAYVKVRAPLSQDNYRWQFLPKTGKAVQETKDECDGAAGISEPEPPVGKWYYISDSHFSEVPESKVLKTEAYLLFYERIL